MIIDGKSLIAGRLASKAAKALIKGESVTILNAEEVVVVGNKESTMQKFTRRVDAAVKGNPHYGPKYARIPDRMFKRTIRNMLPKKNSTKERILGRLDVYNAVPKEFAKEKAITFDDIKCNERHGYMSYKEIALLLGGRW